MPAMHQVKLVFAAIILYVAIFTRVGSGATPMPLPPVPTPVQLEWQRTELTMFLHFGMNTFTNREWGEGTESEKLFDPTAFDAKQWVQVAQRAGFKLMLLTAKHHDGFCLWPSKYTEHCVKNSPWKNGRGDVVREFTDACHAVNMKIGLYLSPWDRNQQTYGTDAYNDYFVNQLTELLSNYGKINEIWFDGACGEGPNGKKQVYDWKRYYATIRRLAPNTLIAVTGPDVRWVGNESGLAKIGETSVQLDKEASKDQPRMKWYPAECDVSIRPGWFYHANEDGSVKTLDELLRIYYASVGRNSVLLLNVPPDPRGLFADADVQRLKEFGNAVRSIEQGRLKAIALAKCFDASQFPAAKAVDGDLNTYWAAPHNDKTTVLELNFGSPRTFNVLNVQEAISQGERVAKYHIDAEQDGRWEVLARGTVIGQRNLHVISKTTAQRIRLVITNAKALPCIAEFGAYLTNAVPPQVELPLTLGKPAMASDVHLNETIYGADKAVDSEFGSRWATNDNTRACWLEIDLDDPMKIGRVAIYEADPRITRFAIEYRETQNDKWKIAYFGRKAGRQFKAEFPPVIARFVRLNIVEAINSPTVYEFQIFAPPKPCEIKNVK